MNPLFLDISISDERIFSLHYKAKEAHKDACVILIPPFGEEKKNSYLTYSLISRELSAESFDVIRFDFRGTGDSDGESYNSDLNTMMDDMDAVIKFARERLGVGNICLLGLRLGASMIIERCKRGDRPKIAILWQPVMNGRDYIRLELRRSKLRRQIIGDGISDVKDDNLNMIDLDGFLVKEALIHQITGMDYGSTLSFLPENTLLVQISYKSQLLSEYNIFEKEGIDIETLIMEPFWNRLGLVDTSVLVEKTKEWLKGHNY